MLIPKFDPNRWVGISEDMKSGWGIQVVGASTGNGSMIRFEKSIESRPTLLDSNAISENQ